jgi:hypothetical protein
MTTCGKDFLEWQKEASQVFEIGFGVVEELVRAKTALQEPQTPIVKLQQLTDENPETWTDRSSEVAIENAGIVDDVDDEGDLILADGAVQFRITGETQAEEPESGEDYSFLVIANRADDPTLQVSHRVWLHILP